MYFVYCVLDLRGLHTLFPLRIGSFVVPRLGSKSKQGFSCLYSLKTAKQLLGSDSYYLSLFKNVPTRLLELPQCRTFNDLGSGPWHSCVTDILTLVCSLGPVLGILAVGGIYQCYCELSNEVPEGLYANRTGWFYLRQVSGHVCLDCKGKVHSASFTDRKG